jgi:DNA/RNA endonuclease YhcR with UshA esterase domain
MNAVHKWLTLTCLLPAVVGYTADTLDPADAADHIGQEATVCGEVTGAKFSSHRKRKPTFIDFGPPHPNQQFTYGKTICVSGTISEHKGKPEIKVSDPSQIQVMGD